MSIKETVKNALGFGKEEYVKVDDKNRFYYMLQQMQAILIAAAWFGGIGFIAYKFGI